MGCTIVTKSGQVIKTTDSFATVQRAMVNKTLIELNTSDGVRKFIDPSAIESIEGEREEVRQSPYKPVANNFPLAMTAEETAAMQAKLQPMKAMFDAKKEAMIEMKRKEDEAMNNSYAVHYGGYTPKEAAKEEFLQGKIEEVAPSIHEVPAEQLVPVPKRGRPSKAN